MLVALASDPCPRSYNCNDGSASRSQWHWQCLEMKGSRNEDDLTLDCGRVVVLCGQELPYVREAHLLRNGLEGCGIRGSAVWHINSNRHLK